MNPEHLLVTVLPGLPTAAEFFLLPDKELTEGKADKTVMHLDQVSINTLLLSAEKKMRTRDVHFHNQVGQILICERAVFWHFLGA